MSAVSMRIMVRIILLARIIENKTWREDQYAL